MRKKILERLQAKKAGSLKKLSQKGLELLLIKLEAKIETEEEIDSKIDDLDNSVIPFDDFVELIQKESDRKSRGVRTALEKEYDFVPKTKTEDDDDDEPADPKKSGTKTNEQIIAAEIAKHLAPFQSLIKGMSHNTTREALKPKLKAKGIPESWVNDIQISENFNEEEEITRLETKWNEDKQLAINQAVDAGTVLKGNAGSTSTAEERIKDFGKSFTDKSEGNVLESI